MTQLKSEQKIWIDTSSKKRTVLQISTWEDAHYHLSLVECKLKQQWNTTTYLIRMVKFFKNEIIQC